jgi:predicted RNA-binding Zn ribbon-like protein
VRYSVGMAAVFDELTMSSLVTLLNGWGSTPRNEAGEQDMPYPQVPDIASELGVSRARVRTTDEALAQIADRVHPVFAAADPAKRARLVDALIRDTGVHPAVSVGQDGVRARWTVEDTNDTLLAAAGVALRSYLAEHGGARMGTCSGRRCADAYVDASPTGKRRFCSITCQNRARVAAFRARQS